MCLFLTELKGVEDVWEDFEGNLNLELNPWEYHHKQIFIGLIDIVADTLAKEIGNCFTREENFDYGIKRDGIIYVKLGTIDLWEGKYNCYALKEHFIFMDIDEIKIEISVGNYDNQG